MNGFVRVLMFIYSVVIAVISVVLLYALVDDGIFADILSPLSSVVTGPISRWVYFAVLLLLFVTSIISITNAITYGRLNRTRLRKTDIGSVDIGADAIENIALNSARAAQVGWLRLRRRSRRISSVIRVSLSRTFSLRSQRLKPQRQRLRTDNGEIPVQIIREAQQHQGRCYICFLLFCHRNPSLHIRLFQDAVHHSFYRSRLLRRFVPVLGYQQVQEIP